MNLIIAKYLYTDNDPTLLREITDNLYQQLSIILPANLAAGFLYTAIMFNVIPQTKILFWLSILIVFVLIRYFAAYQYSKTPVKLKKPEFWYLLFIFFTVIAGSIWGSSIFLLPGEQPVYETITVLFLCGLSSGAVSSLSISRLAFLSFMIPALFPGIIALSLSDSYLCNILSVTMSLYFCFITLTSLKTNKNFVKRLLLEYENNELVKKLNKEKNRIEKFNEALEKQVEVRTNELHEAIEQLQLTQFAVEHSVEAVYQMNSKASFVYVNDAACDSLGYSKKELLNMSVFDIDPVFTQAMWDDAWREIKHTNSLVLETFHRKKDGTVFPVEISVNHLDYKGKEYNYAFVRNITERKLAEEELSLSEEKYAKAFRSSPDKITITTLEEGRFIEANDSFYAVTGYSRDEIIGHTSTELGFWTDPSQRDALARDLKDHKKVTDRDISFRMKNGDIRDFQISAEVITIENEPHILTIEHDVTEIKAANANLLESEERFKSAFVNGPLGMAIVDKKGVIMQVNPKCFDVLGFQPDEMIGKSIGDITHPDDLEMSLKKYAQLISGEIHSYQLEKRYKHKNGAYVWIRLSISSVKDINNEFLYCIALIEDITEHIKIANERVQYQKNLEEEVIQRTHDLTLANQELEAYASTISHDLKAPLRAIEGFADFLHEDYQQQLDATGHQHLTEIQTGVSRMSQMIDDLLLHARLGEQLHEPEAVDFNEVVQHALDNLQHDIQESGAKINIDNKLPTVTGHQTTLEMMMQNLISNAIKFVPPDRHPEVQVRMQTNGKEYTLSVEDNGIGIADEYRKSIFNIFDRLHTRDEYPGTGIGLAIVKKVADLHKGYVWIDSTPGEGSIFNISITMNES